LIYERGLLFQSLIHNDLKIHKQIDLQHQNTSLEQTQCLKRPDTTAANPLASCNKFTDLGGDLAKHR
jgi:hypothetical protein